MTVLLDFVKAEARKRGAFMLKVEPSVLDGDERWLAALKKQGFFPNPYAVHVRNEWVLDLRPDEKALLAGLKEKWGYKKRLGGLKGVHGRKGEGQIDLVAFHRRDQGQSEYAPIFLNKKNNY